MLLCEQAVKWSCLAEHFPAFLFVLPAMSGCSTGAWVAYLSSEYFIEWAHDVVWGAESHVLIQTVRPFHSRGISILLLEVAEKELRKTGTLSCLQITSEHRAWAAELNQICQSNCSCLHTDVSSGRTGAGWSLPCYLVIPSLSSRFSQYNLKGRSMRKLSCCWVHRSSLFS